MNEIQNRKTVEKANEATVVPLKTTTNLSNEEQKRKDTNYQHPD